MENPTVLAQNCNPVVAFAVAAGHPVDEPSPPMQYDVPEIAEGEPELYASGGPPTLGSAAVVPPAGVVTLLRLSNVHSMMKYRVAIDGDTVGVPVGVYVAVPDVLGVFEGVIVFDAVVDGDPVNEEDGVPVAVDVADVDGVVEEVDCAVLVEDTVAPALIDAEVDGVVVAVKVADVDAEDVAGGVTVGIGVPDGVSDGVGVVEGGTPESTSESKH